MFKFTKFYLCLVLALKVDFHLSVWRQEQEWERERKQENIKANKVVFDWLFKNNKNVAFAKISRFDWLSLGFPVSVRQKVELNLTFSREQTNMKIFLCESKNIKLRMPT